MPNRDLHIQYGPTIPQILTHQHRRLLANHESSAVSVASHIVGADGQIRALQAFDTMDVKAFVKDTMLHNTVALPWCHRARPQAVPCSLDVPLDPLFDGGDVGGRILQIFAHILDLGATYHGGLRWAARLGLDGPAAVLDAGGDMVRAAVGFGVLEVEVLGCGRAVVGVESKIRVSTSVTWFDRKGARGFRKTSAREG